MTPVNDFTFYWYAAHEFISGRNPYVPAPGRGFVMFSAPWSFAAIFPLGLLPLEVAQFVWLMVSVVALGLAGVWLWQLYGDTRRPLYAAVLVASFTPVVVSFLMGQLAAVLLFAVAAFIRYEAKRPYVAGGALFILALKPHLVLLLWSALVLAALMFKRWKALAAFVVTLCAATAFAMILRPAIWAEWWAMFCSQQVAFYETPTLGTVLRHVSGVSWMQYLPSGVALGWLALRWKRAGKRWDWKTQFPGLLLVSLVAAPYGWYTDQVLLIPALFTAAVALRGSLARLIPSLAVYLVVNLVGVRLVFDHRLLWYAYIPLIWSALYLFAVHPKAIVTRMSSPPVGDNPS